MTYVSVSRLRVAPDRADDLVASFRKRARLVDDFEGFLGLQVWQSDGDAPEILMVSQWRDRDAFKTYMRSDAHRVSHDRIPVDVEAAIRLERLEHFQTYEVVAE